MNFEKNLATILRNKTKLKEIRLEIPSNPELGDFAFPCFKLGKDPINEARKLNKKIGNPIYLSKIEQKGPYLNFFIKPEILIKETLTKITKEKKKYGSTNFGKGKKIVMDYSHPNIAKPFGIGHLRSTVIGNSIYNILKFVGYEPISVNHLGDWGTQFGKLIVAYNMWGNKKELEKDPIKHLLKLYVRFHKEEEKDETLLENGRAEFKKLEDGNKETLKLWKNFKELSMKEFKRIYTLLNVKFDDYTGESFYVKNIDQTIKTINKKIKTEISEGALIIDLKKYNMPPIILKKSNDSSTYHSRDLTAIIYRSKRYNPEKILYVVGSEHKLYFNQLFKAAKLANLTKSELKHIDFGLIRFPEGKMSTRKGNVIFLEDVLNKSINLAKKIIEKKNPKLKNKQEIAKTIGIGAIIFGDLSNDRTRNINFDWEKILSFEGETAPYIQYTRVRINSILNKSSTRINKQPKLELLNKSEEIDLIKKLYNFPKVILSVAETGKPHHLSNYLIKLSQKFNEYYHKHKVLSENKEEMHARLILIKSVNQVLENGLVLLGIDSPKEM
jgi:arginyl-tRNA synthetase